MLSPIKCVHFRRMLIILVGTLPVFAHAQKNNVIKIDFQDSINLKADTILDLSKPVVLKILKPAQISGRIQLSNPVLKWNRAIDISSNNDTIVLPDLKAVFAGKIPLLQISLEASLIVKKCKLDSSYYRLDISPAGDVNSAITRRTNECADVVTLPGDQKSSSDQSLTIVDSLWQVTGDLSGLVENSKLQDCRKQLVFYYPCCNLIKVLQYNSKSDKYEKKPFVKYYNSQEINSGYGIEFFVANYNITKYTATASTSFVNNFTTTPPFISGFSSYLNPGGAAAGAAAGAAKAFLQVESADPDDVMSLEIRRILLVYQQIKKFLAMDCVGCSGTGNPVADCSNFDAQKKIILQRIHDNFDGGDITAEYASAKRNYFTHRSMKNADYNTLFQANYLVSQNPDSLVSRTQALISTLQTVSFFSQFNVPQVQNADKITFSVNVQPSQGNIGSYNTTNQAISVPIRGGIKIDWSTGVYYSSRSNENYALVPQPNNGDSLQIVKEKNFGKGTAGILALLHMYPRLSTGFNVGLAVGAGISADQNYSGMAGLSILIGRDYRLAISGGLNVASIKALSQSQTLNQNISPTGTVSTYNTFRTGFFLSLTYSFSVSQSTQAASTTSPAMGAGMNPSFQGAGANPTPATTPSSPGGAQPSN
jgi:hypothetical protein